MNLSEAVESSNTEIQTLAKDLFLQMASTKNRILETILPKTVLAVLKTVIEYVTMCDLTGETDGHCHSPTQLVETALLKTDSEFLHSFLTDSQFSSEVLENVFLKNIYTDFAVLHNRIAHT